MIQPSASFASHYSSEQYDAYFAAHSALKGNGTDKVLFKAWADQSNVLESATLAFMRDMADRGQLEVVPFSDRRQLSWPDAWNRMVRQEDPGPFDESRLTEPMGMTLSTTIERSANYAAFVKDMKTCYVHGSGGDCNVTAERLFMRMDGWKPELFRHVKVDGRSQFVPIAEEAPTFGVRHIEIPVPSGELLISDWFRIKAFNEAVDAVKSDRASIATEAGQQMLSAEYATQHGFMSIEAGNSSPEIYLQDDKLIIGTEHYEPGPGDPAPEGKVVGKVETALWWATAIDRETLTEIVARADGRESAEKQVSEYIADRDNGVTTVQMPAGQPLHVYFKSDRSLGRAFETDGAALQGFNTVFAVVSPTEMEWDTMSVKKAGPRP